MTRTVIIAVLLAATGLGATGCSNTFNGFGRDMEQDGQSIQRQF